MRGPASEGDRVRLSNNHGWFTVVAVEDIAGTRFLEVQRDGVTRCAPETSVTALARKGERLP